MPTDELIDIVDENNQPTGQAKPRAEVHSHGYWHRTVRVYILNPQGQFLVHLRGKSKDLRPNTWDTSFGGHIMAGQTAQETAVKELKEEIGIDVNFSELIFAQIDKYQHFTKNREFASEYFYVFTGKISDLNFYDREVQKAKWLNPGQIEQSKTVHPDEWSGPMASFHKVMAQAKRLSLLK